ncbi:hypothetical protein Brms1b_003544 [Colletotrichum noveboracense]|nr:hypothetical protein Brms1b_003544 [Colletotrichum noveboracense]
MDLQHHIALLTLDGDLGLAPPCQPDYKFSRALDVGTGTGIWAIQLADDHPEAEFDLSNYIKDRQHISFNVMLKPEYSVAPNVKFEIDDIEDEWTFSKPFDYIHSRHLTGALANWKEYITNCYNNLTPGGCLELQETEASFLSDDGTLPADSALVRFTELLRGAAEKFGRVFIDVKELKAIMIEVGFEDVTLSRYKWPVNTWPKDPHYREIGAYNYENVMDAVDGLAMAPLTRAYEWTRAEVEVFLVDVRKDVKNKEYHSYAPM